jgi:hypothetical protein
MGSIDREYKGFLLRGAIKGKVWAWRVFNKQKKPVAEGEASSREEADVALAQAVEQIIATRVASRKSGIPTADEYRQALDKALKPNSRLWEMLKAHYKAPGSKMSSAQLAEAAGYKDFSATNSQYGKLGRDICEDLNVNPPGTYPESGEPLWITILVKEGTTARDLDTDHFLHEMRPEVAEALELLGIV